MVFNFFYNCIYSFYSCFIFSSAIVKNNLVVNYLTKYWSGMFMIMSGVFWTVEFEEKLDPKTRYIFCPNHASTLDIPLVTANTVTTSIYGKKRISFYSIIWIFL